MRKRVFIKVKKEEKMNNGVSNGKQENVAYTGERNEQNTDMSTSENDSDNNNVNGSLQQFEGVLQLPKGAKEPNDAQKKAIEADIDDDVLILAGPGSGKTYVIEHRYANLIKMGVKPQNILVCTFSAKMAEEMGRRIIRTCQAANLEQISTIHAFCYRLLCRWYPDSRWYMWRVPKDWQVKSELEDIIAKVWKEKEKPSAKEVFDYICSSKNFGLNADDSYEWFIDVLGQKHGAWLYDIRCKFDAWLNRNKWLTFADMLYLVEQRLKSDSDWHNMLQAKFSHVIIDEAQDTNYQAMRILITISFDPGINTVYKGVK